jgi:hypothetical protein
VALVCCFCSYLPAHVPASASASLPFNLPVGPARRKISAHTRRRRVRTADVACHLPRVLCLVCRMFCVVRIPRAACCIACAIVVCFTLHDSRHHDRLREIEVMANSAFDAFRDMYYMGGYSSVYFWDLDDGFASCWLIKKASDPTIKSGTKQNPSLHRPLRHSLPTRTGRGIPLP